MSDHSVYEMIEQTKYMQEVRAAERTINRCLWFLVLSLAAAILAGLLLIPRKAPASVMSYGEALMLDRGMPRSFWKSDDEPAIPDIGDTATFAGLCETHGVVETHTWEVTGILYWPDTTEVIYEYWGTPPCKCKLVIGGSDGKPVELQPWHGSEG